MNKVGIVVFQNLRYAPFLKFYTNILNEMKNVEYDIIYYNRDVSLNEPNCENIIPISWCGKGTNAAPKHEKAFNFVLYRKKLIKLLKRKKYDFLIMLMTMPSVLIEDYLIKNYKGKYIFDIRDYTQEKFKPYYKIEEKLLNNSALNVISSKGFLNFLPSSKYCICHNLDDEIAKKYKSQQTYIKKTKGPVVISYIGSISYEKQCKELMKLVCEDERFCFYFYGNENTSHKVSEYANSLKCPRIKLMGAFLPNEKRDIYEKSDLVFNCYGNDITLVKYAISNKHYDGALYHRPLLVSPNTVMSEIAGENAFALDLDNIDNLNELFTWYKNLDSEKYISYADKVILSALKENGILKENVIKIINNI